MVNLVRKNQKVFAQNAANNGQFGSLQDGSKILSNDLDVLQASSAFEEGWNQAAVSGDVIPSLEEFQSLNYINTSQISYLMQKGIPEWEVATDYHIGDIAREVGGSNLYQSLTDDNIGNPLSDVVNWQLLGDLVNLNYTADINLQVFTSSGTWNKPLGLKKARVQLVGGGGSGASRGVVDSVGGGGAGGFAESIINAGDLLPSETVTVALGGASVTATSGLSGGTSSFGVHLSATGGQGGQFGSGFGGVGGTGSVSTGMGFGAIGQAGGTGQAGSGAGGNGDAAGNGGNSFFGGGGAGGSALVAGSIPSYGAGAGSTLQNTASTAGGDGLVIIYEYF